MESLFYHHSLDLTFKSAQTLQVIKDYYYLSKLSIPIVVYGTYKREADFILIQKYIGNSNLKVISRRRTFFGKILVKIIFYWTLLICTKKVIVTRHYRKLSEALFLKKILNYKVFHEMHEESFPYLFKAHIKKEKIKSLLLNKRLDCIIFTNPSQELLFKQEFNQDPKRFHILPNGVEVEKFENATMSTNFVLTYLGQFNHWKNVELIFESLSLLDARYTLRIAGGQGDESSKNFINNLLKKYNIHANRVDYLGFIKNHEVANKVLNNSHLLLLPLGDNVQSKFLTSPMKLFEYMATKIPILAVNHPSVRMITSEAIFLSENNAGAFTDQIREICENKRNFNFDSMNLLAQKYSYINRSCSFLEEVIRGN